MDKDREGGWGLTGKMNSMILQGEFVVFYSKPYIPRISRLLMSEIPFIRMRNINIRTMSTPTRTPSTKTQRSFSRGNSPIPYQGNKIHTLLTRHLRFLL